MPHELKSFAIEGQYDIGVVRREIVCLSQELAFDIPAINDISIIITELATNLVKHSVNGILKYKVINRNSQRGLEIVSEDSGPGIKSLEYAMSDGFSTTGTLGSGLGAVKRLSDEFDIYTKCEKLGEKIARSNSSIAAREGIGTIITVRKWTAETGIKQAPGKFNFSVFSRPAAGESRNGDGYFIRETDSWLIAAVIDGLGHGPLAADAASVAMKYLETNYKDNLVHIMRGVHNILKNTRGGVMALVRIDWQRKTLTYCGVGNISIRVLNSAVSVNPISFNGTLGSIASTIKETSFECVTGSVIFMWSDGISAKWNLDLYPALLDKDPTLIADTILRDFGRRDDDATIVVVKCSYKPET